MRRIFIVALAATLLTVSGGTWSQAATRGDYDVAGVEEDDMLKMRAGPGTGYKVIVGLPNGTALRVHSCTQTGGTRWCKVSLAQARNLVGYVSWAYLRAH